MKRERKTRVRLIPKTETCITEWERAVKAYLKQGMTAREAVRKAYEEHPVMHELLTEVRERGEIQLKSGYGKPIPRKVAQKALEIPWAEDGLKLSERTTKGANLVRNWAARTIAKAIRNGDTAQGLTKRLYDGFDFKGGKEILPAQDIPRYLRDLVNAGRKVDGYDAEYRNLLRRARSALERNEAGPLKAAYEEIIRAVETRSEKAIDKAVYVATQENTRYYARRIARTELQRAYQDGEFAQWTNDDDVVAFQWRTSSKHSDCDICDLYKEADLYGLGKGVFPKDKVPSLPLHPHCMCYLKPIMQGAEILQGKTERNRVEQGGREYIDALSKRQREQLLGVNGSKDVLTGRVSWTAKARGYSTGVMRSRIERAAGERGITKKRTVGDPVRRIDRDYIRSSDFGNKFTRLDNSMEVNKQLKVCARKALFNNDGTTNEDIYFIHSETGKLLGKIVGYDYAQGAKYTPEITGMIGRNRGKIITLHSHPNNNPPTGSDLLSAFKWGHKKGYVVTIAGDLHEYELIKKNKEALFIFKRFDNKVARKMNLGYNQAGAIKSVLEELFRFVLWREVK